MDFALMLEKGMREFSNHGAFLTVKSGGIVNTMTISWGFVGFMWARPQFITVVRPQRYTKEVLDMGADSFTVSLPFGNTLAKELSICGTQSGRDINKSEVVRFVPAKSVSSPVVAGCDLYYECKINLVQPLDGAMLPPAMAKEFYSDDFHIFHFGEIVECYSGFSK